MACVCLTPVAAWAATARDRPAVGTILFALAVLLVAAKIGGLAAERGGQPSVLGELVVGIGLGNLAPPLFGQRGVAFVQGDPTLHVLWTAGRSSRRERSPPSCSWSS